MYKIEATFLCQNISHVFESDGTIIPCINIFPPLVIGDQIVNSIYTNQLSPDSDKDITPGDRLHLTLTSNKTKIIIQQRKFLDRTNHTPITCPYCNIPLLHSDRGIGKCINRSCQAQMTPTILRLLQYLGINIHPTHSILIQGLLTRGSFFSPESIFYLNDTSMYFSDINPNDIYYLLGMIHGIRGTGITVKQLLLGLNIPGFDTGIEHLNNLFINNGYTLPKLIDFLYAENRRLITDIDWSPWEEFISIDNNRQSIVTLCNYLFR